MFLGLYLYHNIKTNKMTTHDLDFYGIIIQVTGNYYKGVWASFDEMPEPQEFQIHKIIANGLDLTELLERDMNELENLIIDKHYS